ncbi:hypothetical protein ACFQFQ_28700 [Sulfitobacter porphyrae]|uniref:Uncharacterized protein n=1 Tax=Sulfitobacter porphyrae TaxID=1246864 RepID=A0ABW2BC40_9RHOB
MHIGLALGIIRWRVFELDRYAYYVWVWLAGAVLIFATDLVLLLWLREQPWASLSLALLIGGFSISRCVSCCSCGFSEQGCHRPPA